MALMPDSRNRWHFSGSQRNIFEQRALLACRFWLSTDNIMSAHLLDKPDPAESEVSLATSESIEEEQLLMEECQELVLHFNHRILEALLKATRNALDSIKRRVFFTT